MTPDGLDRIVRLAGAKTRTTGPMEITDEAIIERIEREMGPRSVFDWDAINQIIQIMRDSLTAAPDMSDEAIAQIIQFPIDNPYINRADLWATIRDEDKEISLIRARAVRQALAPDVSGDTLAELRELLDALMENRRKDAEWLGRTASKVHRLETETIPAHAAALAELRKENPTPPTVPDAGEDDTLGRIVREVWVDYAHEIGNPNPAHLLSWDDLDEGNREVDRRIGLAIKTHVVNNLGLTVTTSQPGRGWQ